MLTDSGREISRDDAEKLLDHRTDLKKSFDLMLGDLLTNLPSGPLKQYATSKANGYLFSKKLIQRFFDSPANCEYLLVILAAHNEQDGEFKIGDPTVVVAGVKKAPAAMQMQGEETVYQSMSDDDGNPANEHPPAKILTDFPGAPPLESSDKLYFQVR
jgi:hypothetical protein